MKTFAKRYEEAVFHKFAEDPKAEKDLEERIEFIKNQEVQRDHKEFYERR